MNVYIILVVIIAIIVIATLVRRGRNTKLASISSSGQETKRDELKRALTDVVVISSEKEEENRKMAEDAIKNAEDLHTIGLGANTLLESLSDAPNEFDPYINDNSINIHRRQSKFIEDNYVIIGDYSDAVATSGLTMVSSGSDAYVHIIQNFSANPLNSQYIGWSQKSIDNINQLKDTKLQIESNSTTLNNISTDLQDLYDEAVESFKKYQVGAIAAGDSAKSMRNFLEKLKGLIIDKSNRLGQIDASQTSQLDSVDRSQLTNKEKEWWKASIKLSVASQGNVNTQTLQNEYQNYFELHHKLSNIMKEASPRFSLDDLHTIFHSHIHTLLNLIDNNKIS